MKLRKRFKAQAGSKEVLEKRCKVLQELCGKQRLEVDALRDDAFQSGLSRPQLTTNAMHVVCNWGVSASITDVSQCKTRISQSLIIQQSLVASHTLICIQHCMSLQGRASTDKKLVC